ncbi:MULTISPECIES: hypothetical protein [Pacificibacter]|uniref:hypothetical protein n=1 Tax=Pacificibacter TaxID=1042323 RepID=UPI001C09C97E|nr:MULTISPECIES: hypothetical protein [Pacificibacter]MBU2935598.1 hypothetical protein [Pacificibacter marinus]MDO6614094.1 hypothetical protein [Pacificibacter sp. 1_MG-2023]
MKVVLMFIGCMRDVNMVLRSPLALYDPLVTDLRVQIPAVILLGRAACPKEPLRAAG